MQEKKLLQLITNFQNSKKGLLIWVPVVFFGLGLITRYVLASKLGQHFWQTMTTTKCIICFDKGRQVLFLPCKHLSVCGDCSLNVRICPMCRARILQRVQIDSYINF